MFHLLSSTLLCRERRQLSWSYFLAFRLLSRALQAPLACAIHSLKNNVATSQMREWIFSLLFILRLPESSLTSSSVVCRMEKLHLGLELLLNFNQMNLCIFSHCFSFSVFSVWFLCAKRFWRVRSSDESLSKMRHVTWESILMNRKLISSHLLVF